MAERRRRRVQRPSPPSPVMVPRDKERRALLLKEEVKDRFGRRNAMILELRRRRYQEQPIDIPPAYRATTREVRLPLIADVVDLMVAIINDAEMRVHVDPYDVGPVAERNSSLRERWSEAVLDQLPRELGRPVLDLVTENQIGDGIGVLKVIYRPDHWRDLPTAEELFGRPADELAPDEVRELARRQEQVKRGAKLPFTLIDVDPLTYYPVHGPDGELQAVIEITERPLRSVLAEYTERLRVTRSGKVVSVEALGEPLAEDEAHLGDPARRVEVWEYHDLESVTTFVEDVPVKYVEHGIGQVPYFECYAKPTSSRDPERASRPTLYKQVWLEDFINTFFTMMTNAGALYCYPTPITETPPGIDVPLGSDGRPDAIQYEAGKHLVLYQGQKFAFATPPAQHIQLMSNLINQALQMFQASSGLGPAIRGLAGGDQTGYAINQLIQASMLSLRPAIRSRAWMLERVIAYLWRLIERRIQDTVWVWGTNPDPDRKDKRWLGLGPKDIAGYYKVEVDTRPLVDQMLIARGSFALQMVKGELISRRRALEQFLRIENPEDELDAIEIDKALSQGPLHDMWVQAALKRAGIVQPQPQGGSGGGPPGTPGGVPGLPGGGLPLQPAGPGVGMPLVPPEPQPPVPSAEQLQVAAQGGRPAGAERQPPTIQPVPLVPENMG